MIAIVEPGAILASLLRFVKWASGSRQRTQQQLDQHHNRVLAEEAADNVRGLLDGPTIIERWITETLTEAQCDYGGSPWLEERTRDFVKRVTIMNTSELAAARGARQHPQVTRVTNEPQRIGDTLEMHVRNPSFRG